MWHPFMTPRTYMSVVESAHKQQWSCIALRPKNRSKNKSIEYAIWPFLDNEVDVPEGHVLDLWLPGQQGDQGGGELLQQGVVVVRLLGQQLQELHQHLDGGQNHRRVGVGQPGGDALTDAWGRSRKKKVALGRGGWSVTTATAITLEVEYIFYWWSCPHVFQSVRSSNGPRVWGQWGTDVDSPQIQMAFCCFPFLFEVWKTGKTHVALHTWTFLFIRTFLFITCYNLS